MNQYILPTLFQHPKSLRRRLLPFYRDESLYEVRSQNGEKEDITYLLWKPGSVTRMDWKSTPIHKKNEEHRDYMHKSFLDSKNDDYKTVKDYLIFFCDMVCGEEGPYTIVENTSHTRFNGNDFEKMELGYKEDVSETTGKQAERDKVRGFSIEQTRDENGNIQFIADNVCVWYDDFLYTVKFTVDMDGMVEMDDDHSFIRFGEDEEEKVTGSTTWHLHSDYIVYDHPIVKAEFEGFKLQKIAREEFLRFRKNELQMGKL